MPYIPHILTSFRGGLGSATGPESWSVNLRWRLPSPQLYATADAANFATDFRTFFTNANLQIQTGVYFNEVRMYPIGADGKATDTPTIAQPTFTVGPAQSAYHPWQCSMVVSLNAAGLGKGKRGRIYLPPNSIPIGANTGQISQGTAVGIADAFDAFLNATKARRSGAGPILVIAGKTGTGTLRDVVGVRVGMVMDTQRRRRRGLSEQYVLGAAASGYQLVA